MSAAHRIELAEPGTLVGARVVCLGTDDDECHQWCGEGCEEECTGYPWLPADTPLIAQAPLVGHRAEIYPGCRIADWLNAGDLDETCTDEEILDWDEDGETRPALRSALIAAEWDGEDYLWSYDDEIARAAAEHPAGVPA